MFGLKDSFSLKTGTQYFSTNVCTVYCIPVFLILEINCFFLCLVTVLYVMIQQQQQQNNKNNRNNNNNNKNNNNNNNNNNNMLLRIVEYCPSQDYGNTVSIKKVFVIMSRDIYKVKTKI